MSRSVVQLNCYTKHHRNTSLTNLHCELKEPVQKSIKMRITPYEMVPQGVLFCLVLWAMLRFCENLRD